MTQHKVLSDDSMTAMDEIARVLGQDAVILSTKKIGEKIEIIGSIKNKLANFKQPKKIILIPELPRNAMGKVEKQKLRSIYNKLFD